jgi:hypothetical protein
MAVVINRSKFVERQLEMSKYIGKRKHGSQLQQEETNIIWDRLKSFDQWEVSPHALDRLVEKGIKATYEDIVSTIDNATIVEYKIDYNERINRCDDRVVLRANAIVNDTYNLNVVYSLSRGVVVTVWINHINDFHDTLDWSIYSEDMKVFGAE